MNSDNLRRLPKDILIKLITKIQKNINDEYDVYYVYSDGDYDILEGKGQLHEHLLRLLFKYIGCVPRDTEISLHLQTWRFQDNGNINRPPYALRNYPLSDLIKVVERTFSVNEKPFMIIKGKQLIKLNMF